MPLFTRKKPSKIGTIGTLQARGLSYWEKKIRGTGSKICRYPAHFLPRFFILSRAKGGRFLPLHQAKNEKGSHLLGVFFAACGLEERALFACFFRLYREVYPKKSKLFEGNSSYFFPFQDGGE